MKKIFTSILAVTMLLSMNVNAFELTEAYPDKSVYENKRLNEDKTYLDYIANSYSDRYIVEELNIVDISVIDQFFNKLSSPMTVDELDNSKPDFNSEIIESERLKRKFNLFKLFGGLAGYSVNFEPVVYYKVHRDIYLIGGYSVYEKTCENPDEAYWNCLCKIEDMTREVVDYDTRIQMQEKIKELSEFMDKDNSFKIFILKDNNINSLWEKTSYLIN